MSQDSTIRVGDWIERHVVSGSPWARVVTVFDAETVSVVYLDDDTPVQDRMIFEAGDSRFERNGPSGIKIREASQIKHWRQTLREGPPFQIGAGTPQLVYLPSKGSVWRRRRSED
jgi:hypothetical protein